MHFPAIIFLSLLLDRGGSYQSVHILSKEVHWRPFRFNGFIGIINALNFVNFTPTFVNEFNSLINIRFAITAPVVSYAV